MPLYQTRIDGVDSAQVDLDWCMQACYREDVAFTTFGLEWDDAANDIVCSCAKAIPSPAPVATSGCDIPCPHNAAQLCGGRNYLMSPYMMSCSPAPVAPPVAPPKPVCSVVLVNGTQQCWQDSQANPIMQLNVDKTVTTLQSCWENCPAGYDYFGVEGTPGNMQDKECWCGRYLSLPPSGPISPLRCVLRCDDNMPCGGEEGVMSIYQLSCSGAPVPPLSPPPSDAPVGPPTNPPVPGVAPAPPPKGGGLGSGAVAAIVFVCFGVIVGVAVGVWLYRRRHRAAFGDMPLA